MNPVSLVDVNSYMPEQRVGLDFYSEGELAESLMFKAPKWRRHISPGETAASMVVNAARPMLDRLRADGEDVVVDIILTNVALPDRAFTGAGADIARRLELGSVPEWILDVHNGGCASFMYMMKIAKRIIEVGDARTALVCNVQNTAGLLFSQPTVRGRKHAPVPGDGCGVGFLRVGDESPVLDVVVHHGVEYAEDMDLICDTRRYWEPGDGELDITFTDSKVAQIISRGNQQVPAVVHKLCQRLGTSTTDIDILVTNQPNRMFLRNWREALQLPQERHLDTFDQYGNLFGAGVPVTLDHARRDGKLGNGDLIVLAGFAHAGDFAAAAAVRW